MSYNADFSFSNDHIYDFIFYEINHILNITISCHVDKSQATMSNFTVSVTSELKHLILKHADLIQFKTPQTTKLSNKGVILCMFRSI
jgi:hypothetical protein